MAGKEEERVQIRDSLKAQSCFNNYPKWKEKLRENCYTRVREDRSRLLWKLRFANNQPHKDLVKSSLEDIVFDEIQKFKHSYQSETFDNSKFSLALDDAIWQYDGLHEAYQGDCEEMLLEMQRIFYEDLRMEETKEQVSNETWEDEEDEYLARAVYEHMNLNEKAGKEVWCPICKQGELKEDCHHIYCSPCGLRLNRDDEVNLEVLQNRLDEAHSDHLDQGCSLHYMLFNCFSFTPQSSKVLMKFKLNLREIATTKLRGGFCQTIIFHSFSILSTPGTQPWNSLATFVYQMQIYVYIQ